MLVIGACEDENKGHENRRHFDFFALVRGLGLQTKRKIVVSVRTVYV